MKLNSELTDEHLTVFGRWGGQNHDDAESALQCLFLFSLQKPLREKFPVCIKRTTFPQGTLFF